MNEIKFRAWSDKQMIELDEIELGKFDYPIMQFTGFEDKSGKKIWEGDLVENNAKIIWEIEWNQDKGCWRYIRYSGYGNTGFGLTSISSKKMKIIGNIYENPELTN